MHAQLLLILAADQERPADSQAAVLQRLQQGQERLEQGLERVQQGQERVQRLIVSTHNLAARTHNAAISLPKHPLQPLLAEQPGEQHGQLPPNGLFPATRGECELVSICSPSPAFPAVWLALPCLPGSAVPASAQSPHCYRVCASLRWPGSTAGLHQWVDPHPHPRPCSSPPTA